jgi:hypothetical protein
MTTSCHGEIEQIENNVAKRIDRQFSKKKGPLPPSDEIRPEPIPLL